MEFVAFKGRLAGGSGGLQEAVFHLAVFPVLDGSAIEQHGGSFRCLGSEGGAFAFDAREDDGGGFTDFNGDVSFSEGEGEGGFFVGDELVFFSG